MKIILNPKYERLRDYLTHIDFHFEQEGKEIFHDRNVVRTLRVDGLTLCVKRYAPLSLRGNLAIRLYKASKGKKAYFKPFKLRERGFESPEPVAFVCYRKGLFSSVIYLVCLQSTYRYSLDRIMDFSNEERREITRRFANFAARLHNDGFLHRDFSASNILFDKVDNRYHFALIDTNSLRTGHPVSIERGCRNLSQLIGDEDFFKVLADTYANARNADAATCLQHIMQAKRLGVQN